MDSVESQPSSLIENSPPSSYFRKHLSSVITTSRSRRTQKRYLATNVRQNIDRVFEGLGGWEGMLAWAKDNPSIFYGQVLPKCLPRIAPTEGDMNVLIQIRQITQQLTEKPLKLSTIPPSSATPTEP